MARGQKTCPNGHANGPRAKHCSTCNHEFAFKDKTAPVAPVVKQKKKRGVSAATLKRHHEGVRVECDWRSLVRGDRIKVMQGSGPYFPIEGGDPINMGYAGKFVVLYITKDCIHATGNSKEGDSARCVIYMGEPNFNEETGIQREPHRVIKLKQRKQENANS